MDENEFRKDEAFINQNSQHIQTKDIPKIQKCICKFHQYDQKDEKQIIGTGFFLKFPFGKKEMRVLLTSYHVLDINNKDYINYTNEENEKELYISNREIIKSDSNNLDYICIPLFEHDNIENFLDIDKNIFNPGYNLKDKQIQIYKYDLTLSLGKIINIKDKKEIFYDCNTEAGWSGGPILTKDNKVIGIHKGTDNKEKLNYGICIKNIIEDIKDQIQKLKDGNEKM